MTDAEARARASADAMWADDAASRDLGMVLDSVGPGRAVLSITVADVAKGSVLSTQAYPITSADPSTIAAEVSSKVPQTSDNDQE